MLNTSVLRLTAFILALATLFLTACSTGPEVFEETMVVRGYDFTKYTDEGFLITPEKYQGRYQSIATLSVTLWPRMEKREVKVNVDNPSPNTTKEEWRVTDPVSTEEVIDSLYTRAQSLGADAIINFQTELPTEDLEDGPMRIGVRARGFAIDREE